MRKSDLVNSLTPEAVIIFNSLTEKEKARLLVCMLDAGRAIIGAQGMHLLPYSDYIVKQVLNVRHLFLLATTSSLKRNIFHFYRHAYRRRVSDFSILLARKYPNVFCHPSSKKFQILALGVSDQLLALLEDDSKVVGHIFFEWWTKRTVYLSRVVSSKDRYDLQGNVTESIAPTERAYAVSVLRARDRNIKRAAKRRLKNAEKVRFQEERNAR